MTSARFAATFAPAGAIALHDLQITDDGDDSVRCRARLRIHSRTETREASAHGTIRAMTEILHDLGAGVEIVSLYHQQDGDQIAAYLLCERDGERCWAYGRAPRGDDATIAALIAGANQLAAPAQA